MLTTIFFTRRVFHSLVLVLVMHSSFWTTETMAQTTADDPLSAYRVQDGDFRKHSPAKVELGQLLMFDKILSGNRDISCATCHHPLTWTSDGLSLSIGTGGRGLSVMRDPDGRPGAAVKDRVPRNAPSLFNLGAREFTTLFHDGRISINPFHPSGFSSPAGDYLPGGLDSIVAAQAMFPVTSIVEMAGQPGENSIADAAAMDDMAGVNSIWQQLADRLRSVPEYVRLFKMAYPGKVNKADDITYVHAANAIAAFEESAWRCTDSPFDQYMRGNPDVVTPKAVRGGQLFYGEAGCASCHQGKFQTDQQFHAIAMPQIGPGKGDNTPGFLDGREDFGRERVTGKSEDRYKFRTPSLRQVTLTGPWGHSGAYNSLEAVVRHHLNPVQSLHNYDVLQRVLPKRADLDAQDLVVHSNYLRRRAIAAANELHPIELTDAQVDDLIAFLHTLTDTHCIDLRRDIPRQVPSGLPVADLR